jgi:hypothetical protein
VKRRRRLHLTVGKPDTDGWAKNMVLGLDDNERWALRQALAGYSGQRFYGDGGTIWASTHLDVETFQGTVVSVWFRCQMLRFNQTEVDGRRAESMEAAIPDLPSLSGVEVGQ